MELVIRTAGSDDADSVSSLAVETYVEAFRHSFSPDDLGTHIRQKLSAAAFAKAIESDVVLLAELSRRLVGYVQFGAAQGADTFGADAELRRLYVHESARSQGIGSRLMETALAHPLLAGARSVALDVWVQNERAQHFYRRYGFLQVGEREFKVASGAETTPDIVMVRKAPSAA